MLRSHLEIVSVSSILTIRWDQVQQPIQLRCRTLDLYMDRQLTLHFPKVCSCHFFFACIHIYCVTHIYSMEHFTGLDLAQE